MPLADWFDSLGGVTHIEGNLYRSPLPYTRDHFRAIERHGIRIVYSMEHAIPAEHVHAHGFDWRPHFWTDDMPPRIDEMDRFLDDYLKVSDETPVLVHCKAGWGRTGSAISCALVAKKGWTAERAMRHFWGKVPRAEEIMTRNGQAEMVRGYAARLKGRGLP